MSIKDRATEIFREIQNARNQEDEVVHETTDGNHESIREAFADQEQVIQMTAGFEEELTNLLVSDHGDILEKTEEFISWEKEVADTFEQLLEKNTLQQVVDQLNSHDWDGLEGSERVLASKLRALEQEREQITSDISQEDVETIEFLLDSDQVVDDIDSLHDLIEEETQQKQIIERQVGENEQVGKQERQLQKVRENFRSLLQIKNRIQRLRDKRKKALKNSKQTISEALNQIRTAKSSIPSNRGQRPHNFQMVTAVLEDYDKLATRIHQGDQGMSRRDFLAGATAGIAAVTYSSTVVENLAKLENQMNENIEEAEKEIEEKREAKKSGKANTKELDKEKGKIDTEENPFRIEYLIQNTEYNDKALELKVKNTAERKVELDLSFAIPSGINLHGGLNINSSSAGIISSKTALEPGETQEIGIFYRRTDPRAELVSINIDYTFDEKNWYSDQMNVSFDGRNVEKMIQNQGVIERKEQNYRIKWRTLETFLDQNEFINLELVAEPVNATRTVELEYETNVPGNWQINGLTGFLSAEENSADTGELHLNSGKQQDKERLPLFPAEQKVNQLSLQKTGKGNNAAEIQVKTKNGDKIDETIKLI